MKVVNELRMTGDIFPRGNKAFFNHCRLSPDITDLLIKIGNPDFLNHDYVFLLLSHLMVIIKDVFN
jgi:hypothetical protein